MERIKVIVEKTNTGFSAYVDGDGYAIGTVGDNRAEIKKMYLKH